MPEHVIKNYTFYSPYQGPNTTHLAHIVVLGYGVQFYGLSTKCSTLLPHIPRDSLIKLSL